MYVHVYVISRLIRFLSLGRSSYSGIHNSCNTLFFGQWRLWTLDGTFRVSILNFGTLDGGFEGDSCYIATPRRQILAGLADLRLYRPFLDASRPPLRHSFANQGRALRICNFMCLSTRPYDFAMFADRFPRGLCYFATLQPRYDADNDADCVTFGRRRTEVDPTSATFRRC